MATFTKWANIYSTEYTYTIHICFLHLLLCEAAGYEVVINNIHITHPRHVGGETTNNLEGGRVKDVHLTGDVTAAEVLLRELEQANPSIGRGLYN